MSHHRTSHEGVLSDSSSSAKGDCTQAGLAQGCTEQRLLLLQLHLTKLLDVLLLLLLLEQCLLLHKLLLHVLLSKALILEIELLPLDLLQVFLPNVVEFAQDTFWI